MFNFCGVTLRRKFYIATLHAEHAEIFEIFLTLAPPPPIQKKWIDAPAKTGHS